jgi:sucrose-6-phosphatase
MIAVQGAIFTTVFLHCCWAAAKPFCLPLQGKHEAMDYLRRKLGFSYESTVAAGDSGNDRAMFEGRNRGIIVGNSQPDLLDWLAAQRQQGVDDGRLVLTGKARARGILEGLAHFGFL